VLVVFVVLFRGRSGSSAAGGEKGAGA